MKRVLSLVLALVLVLGMIPTFAADMTGGQYLFDNEFIAGDGMGNLNEADMLTREQLAKLILELNGSKEEAEALTLPPSFTDSAKISAWARPYVAYAQIEGLMVGFTDGSFRPMDGVTGQQLAAVLTRALGYEFEWATVIADAADLGIDVPAVAKLTRGEAFEAMWVTVNTMPNGETELTLGQQLGKIDPPVVVEPVAFAVDSVTAINNKQIEIKFTSAVDSTMAVDESNYTVLDKGTSAITLSATSASLSEDKMTVTLNLNNAATDKLTNSSLAKVTVAKGFAAADGSTLAAAYSNAAVVVYDGIAPTVTKVEATGLKTIDLTFTEPVYDVAGGDLAFTSANFVVKSGTYTYFVNSAVAVDNVVTLTLGTNLIEGSVAVTINKNAEIADYAGIKAFEATVNYDFVKDTTAPVVSVKEATQTTVTLQFNKPVNATSLNLYHSVSGVSAYGDTQSISAAKEVTFTFGNKLPQGDVKLYLVNSTTSGQEVTDLFGNKMADTNLMVTITVDNTAPVVATTKLNTNATFDITFSEKIDTAQAVASNFSVKDADGNNVAFSVSNDGLKKVTLTFSPVLEDNSSYQVSVLAMKDLAGNSLAATESFNVSVGDNTPPTVASAYQVSSTVAYVVFSEDMNQTDMLNKAMYLVDGDNDATFTALGDDDTLTAVSSKKVKITMAAATFDTTNQDSDLLLGQIRDTAGKVLTNSTTFSTPVSNLANDTLTLEKVELTAKNKAKLTFSKELANFDNSEVDVINNTGGAAFTADIQIQSVDSMTVLSTGKTEVVVTLDQDIMADATYLEGANYRNVDFKVVGAANTKSVEGTVLANATVTLADKLAPSIKYVDYVSATKILVVFDEALDQLSVAGAGTNGFSVSGGTLTSAIKDTTYPGTVIVLTGSSFTSNTDVTYTAGNITDNATAKNKLATVTKSSALSTAVLTSTAASTPDATATIAVSNFDEVYTAGGPSDVKGATATIGDFTFTGTITGGVAGDDVLTVAITTGGVITVAYANGVDTTNNITAATLLITNTTTGATDTAMITVSAGGVVTVTNN